VLRLILVVLATVLVASCGTSGSRTDPPASATSVEASAPAIRPAPGTHRGTLRSGGRSRTFRVYAPAGFDPSKRLPLVVALHFFPGSGDAMQELAGLDDKADKEQFLVVYPDGYLSGFNALVCCGDQDDVGFVKAVVDQMVSTWNADPDRVYATGISNGGDMSFKLAVEVTGTFAAIGAVSGGFIGAPAARADYAPKRPVSVITIIGQLDTHYGSFEAGVKTWQERLACKPAATKRTAAYTRAASRCGDGSDVEVYTLPELGHSWPGAAAGQLADPDAGLRATDVLWSFFAAHRRAATQSAAS
jgi:poly(3-hydroxybutyrate) depolymerase